MCSRKGSYKNNAKKAKSEKNKTKKKLEQTNTNKKTLFILGIGASGRDEIKNV